MLAHLLLPAALLAGAAAAAPTDAAPALRTAEVVRQELKAEAAALRDASRTLEEAARAGAPPEQLESYRLAAQRLRVRRGQLQAELEEIREAEARLAAAGLDGDRLAELRLRLAALRAEWERLRTEVAAARLQLTGAATREELSAAEARLTRAEGKLAEVRREMSGIVPMPKPEF
jgi:chromosome segregation ATPase